MDENLTPQVVTTIKRGGRPRKYANAEERKIAAAKQRREARAAKLVALAAGPPLPEDLPDPRTAAGLQDLIEKAVRLLPVDDAMFVTEMCTGASASAAYRKAHPAVTVRASHIKGPQHLAKPEIAKAIAEVKAGLAASVAYDHQRFMREMDGAMEFARRTGNATALVRAVELRGKANGQLNDKPAGGAAAGFTLIIGGIDSPVPLESAE